MWNRRKVIRDGNPSRGQLLCRSEPSSRTTRTQYDEIYLFLNRDPECSRANVAPWLAEFTSLEYLCST
eukprot:COSAG02_NODE_24585_length_683_cov_1.335616_1_plen_67_part_01